MDYYLNSWIGPQVLRCTRKINFPTKNGYDKSETMYVSKSLGKEKPDLLCSVLYDPFWPLFWNNFSNTYCNKLNELQVFLSRTFSKYSNPFLILNNRLKKTWNLTAHFVKWSRILVLSRSGGRKSRKLHILRQLSVAKTTTFCGNSQSNPQKSQLLHLIPLENETVPTVRFSCFLDQFISNFSVRNHSVKF